VTAGERPAIAGGKPVRATPLPYGRQSLDEDDVAAVAEVLRGDWLTTGPTVAEFERAFAKFVGTAEAVAVNSGTAALHVAVHAADIGPGDEVLVPAMTFAASANCVVFQGGTPVFVDVDADTLLIEPASVEARLSPRTKAIIAVDYAGQPCDYAAIGSLAAKHKLAVVCDACHSVGGSDNGRPVGGFGDSSAFSFHPVKHLTTGEGGMVTTDRPEAARRMRSFRNHGISSDHRQREQAGSWFYEMVDLGYNYRITDFQCALGLRQLAKLPQFLARRRAIAARYDKAFGELHEIRPLTIRPSACHAYHLYVIQLQLERLRATRAEVFAALRAEGLGVNVHYIPVHLHPYYRERFDTAPGLCPVAEAAYERIVSLPLFPAMTDRDAGDVIDAVTKVIRYYAS
jgi:perosamine synthetase